MKRSISRYTVLRISIAAVFLLVTFFLTGNHVLALLMGVVGYFALRVPSWFNAWGWPFIWILLIPMVTLIWSAGLLEQAVDEGTCTLTKSAEGYEFQFFYEIWRCPREDVLPTLLPGLLNLVAFAWVLSGKREVRWAALMAGTLGAVRLAVPAAIYWHSGAYLEIHGPIGLPDSARASSGLWLLSAVSAFVFLVKANMVASRKRMQAVAAMQAPAQDEQAQLLGRLPDEGLITDEEYESQRGDLPPAAEPWHDPTEVRMGITSGSTSGAMRLQTVAEVGASRKLGLALRGLGLWQLALGGLVLSMAPLTTPGGDEAFFGLLTGMLLTLFALGLVGLSWASLGGGFFRSPWLLSLGAGLVGALATGGTILFLTPLVAEGIGIGVAYLIVHAVLRAKERGWKWESQGPAQDQCKNCGKRLTVDDKARNRGTGLCWVCLSGPPKSLQAEE